MEFRAERAWKFSRWTQSTWRLSLFPKRRSICHDRHDLSSFHQAFIMFLWEHLGAVRLWSMSQRVTTWNAETWNVRLLHDYRINYSEYFRVMSTCHHDVPCVKRIVGTEVFLRLSSGILERRLHSNVTFTEDEEGLAAEACANLCYVCFDSFVSLCYPKSFSIPRKSRKCMEMYQVHGKCWNCK